jgi:hypothetical protein
MTNENKSLGVVPCETSREIQADPSIMLTEEEKLKQHTKKKTEDSNELDDFNGEVK